MCAELNKRHLLNQFVAGAQLDLLKKVIDKSGPAGTPLCLAVEKGHVDIVRILISLEADAKIRNPQGQAPIHIAVMKGHANLMEVYHTFLPSPLLLKVLQDISRSTHCGIYTRVK